METTDMLIGQIMLEIYMFEMCSNEVFFLLEMHYLNVGTSTWYEQNVSDKICSIISANVWKTLRV